MELLLRTLAIESATLALVWFGYVEGVEGARNVFSAFLFFVLVPLSFFMYSKSMADRSAKDDPLPFMTARRYIVGLGTLACVILLAWVGELIHAGAFIWVWFSVAVMWKAVDNIRKDAKAIDNPTKHPHNAT